ncbi:GntR family transcriptional regulator [Nonomuraea sp. NPDC049646]|uniref:GntR family transcriptional regulator n=1 Tax=unclassified Nonomuraea TaxID=2593643 RepID=UPI00378CB2D6
MLACGARPDVPPPSGGPAPRPHLWTAGGRRAEVPARSLPCLPVLLARLPLPRTTWTAGGKPDAQLVEPLQNRIEPGDYPPGTLLPSENQLIKEFSISRPTVVVALRGCASMDGSSPSSAGVA